MRDVIIGGLLVAAVIILVRVIVGTPMVKRVMESFQSGGGGPALLNTVTECPSGAQMYMYEGKAYCCSGQVNPDADTIKQTCRAPIYPPNAPFTFCTLGPSGHHVKNCLELRAGLMAAEGASFCPASKPNFCKGGAAGTGRCCAGPVNANFTDCADPMQSAHCDRLPEGKDPLTDATSCEFLRLAETDAAACPAGYHQVIAAGQGSFAGLNIYGCTNMSQTCYSADMIARLQRAGKDTSKLQACSSTT